VTAFLQPNLQSQIVLVYLFAVLAAGCALYTFWRLTYWAVSRIGRIRAVRLRLDIERDMREQAEEYADQRRREVNAIIGGVR
jgi:hypothetical protein